MTWLRPLDDLAAADLDAVGCKAYWLSVLKRQGMPVAQGVVLTAAAWHQTVAGLLETVGLETAGLGVTEDGRWIAAAGSSFRELQQTSQRWQRALCDRTAPPALPALDGELAGAAPAAWMLRASVSVRGEREPGTAAGWGLLPAQIEADVGGLPQVLPQFWSQALAARCLVVWMRHCDRIQDLNLATLIMPVYPALTSGTLTYTQGQGQVAAVLGLGLALSRGEAIPARCRVSAKSTAPAVWEEGFQERIYQLLPATQYRSPGQSMAQPIQVLRRDRPAIGNLLGADQLAQLSALGEQTCDRLGWPGVRLEWLFCPGSDPAEPVLMITQATPWSDPAGALTRSPSGVGKPRSQPALLPAVSTVVQGIGAAAGRAQGVAVVARRPQDLPVPLPQGSIVVLPDLQPDVFLQLHGVVGIVIERGGATCHAAILAREVGIPAVVGAPQATQLLDPDMVLWLDGDRGVVYGLDPEAPAYRQFQAALAQFQTPDPRPDDTEPTAAEQSARYRGMTTQVMVNLSQGGRLSTLSLEHIAGIGLLRSEWLMLDILEGRHPWDWVNQGQEAELQSRLVDQLEPIAAAIGPRPLRYRSLDLRSHEWQALHGSPPLEPNPMLGLRGTLSYDVDDRLFKVELGALATLQRAGHTNLQLILPFVRTVEEVLACRPLIEQAGLTDTKGFALWIMAEVPSVLFLLPAYAQAGVQGIAIGSNDLTQLLLAVDRDQPVIASAYDERHPVVRLALGYLVQEARRLGLACSICGQAPVRHPDLIADLVAWGITSISVEAAALPFTLEAVWQAEQQRPEGA